jgi:hypothetical protein
MIEGIGFFLHVIREKMNVFAEIRNHACMSTCTHLLTSHSCMHAYTMNMHGIILP